MGSTHNLKYNIYINPFHEGPTENKVMKALLVGYVEKSDNFPCLKG